MQAIGQSTEECAAGAYCYNMTAQAYFLVDAVKAGCSTWRCMVRTYIISLPPLVIPAFPAHFNKF